MKLSIVLGDSSPDKIGLGDKLDSFCFELICSNYILRNFSEQIHYHASSAVVIEFWADTEKCGHYNAGSTVLLMKFMPREITRSRISAS